MIVLTYTLKLLEPLLATSLQGDPNSAVSYHFIPGSLIRGCLIGRYLAQPEAVSSKEFAVDKDTRRLFLNGKTRYLNAYALDKHGRRTLPTPLSWYKEKGAKLTNTTKRYSVYDKANPGFDEAKFFEEIDQPKPEDAKFCSLEDNDIELYFPDMQVSVHTQRERRAGKAIEDDGAIFRYEALAPGQLFGGVILLERDSDARQIKELLTGELVIGGSRSAGYGRVRVKEVNQFKNQKYWSEINSEPESIDAGAPFTLTLLSDLLIRDANGQFADTLKPSALAQAIGISPETLARIKAYKQNDLVGGFNRKWGLPLPQTLSIKAGSVFCFTGTVDIPAKRLKSLLANGLGERRAEGFGRVAVNWIQSPYLQVNRVDEEAHPSEPPPLSKTSWVLAQRMTNRLLLRDADRKLGEAINKSKIHPSPTRSQIGGLRVVIRSAMAENSAQQVLTHLNDMKDAGRRQFEQSRLSGFGQTKLLFDWLSERLNKNNLVGIWQFIGFIPGDMAKTIGEIRADATSALSTEYTLRLIDGVLAKAAKEKGEQNEQ